MIIYLLIPIIILLFRKQINKRRMTIPDYILLIVLILVCGLRKNVGTDYKLYTLFFYKIESFQRIEFFFRTIIKALNDYNFDVTYFFMICSILTILPAYIIIKKRAKYPVESLFLYISLGFYALQFNMIRQMIAIIVTFYSFKFIEKKQFLRFLICILISTLFHNTSIIFIPFYFLSYLHFNKKQMILILIFEFLLVFIYQPFMLFITSNFEAYQVYSQVNSYTLVAAGVGTYVILIFNLILMFLLILNKDKLIQNNMFNNNYINMILYSFAFYFLGLNNTVLIRLSYYFFIYIIFLLPELFDVINFDKNSKNVIALYLFFLIYYILHLVSFNSMIPYNSIL